jgi:hypothetical protein
MSRTLALHAACLICLAVLVAGCGRSNLHLEDDFVDVSVGLTAVSGPELSESQVSLSLSRFDFTLLSFDQRPTCGGGQVCYQAADGSLPASQVFQLQDFRDGNLQVVFVNAIDALVPATLPDRN